MFFFHKMARGEPYMSDLVIVFTAVYFSVMGAQYWLEKGSMCDKVTSLPKYIGGVVE